MIKFSHIALVTAAAGFSMNASAFSQATHQQMAIDAVNYMKAHPTTTNYAKLLKGATAAGDSLFHILEQ